MTTLTPEAYLDALLTLPALSAPKVSPDGKWVAWTWFRAGPAADLYAAPTDGSSGPIRLTATSDNTFLVAWTPDSRALLAAQDRDGDERFTLYRVDLDQPLTLTPLTELEPNYFLRGGHLHGNGRWLVYGANYDFAAGREIEATWIYRHDLETGERLVLARPVKGGWIEPALSPTGEHVLYQRLDRHPAGRQTWVVGIDGQNDREVLNAGPDVKTAAAWFPDGRRLLVLAEAPTHRRLGILNLVDGGLRWLIDDPARNLEDAYVPFSSQHIVVVEVRAARLRAVLLDPATGAEMAVAPSAGNLLPLAPVGGGQWVGQRYGSRQPADLVRFSPSDLRPESFVSLARTWERTPLTPDDLTQAEDFRWRSVDGLEIQGWLYRPQGPARGAIVYVHGGPTSHSQDMLNVQIQFYVRQGFVVLDPNYRGSTGFSQTFREAIKATGWGGLEQDDIRTGIQALIAAGLAAPGQVAITGTSYGGYSAWHALTHFAPAELAAAAPICGMTDLVVDYQTTRPDLRPYSEEMMGGSPEQVPQRYQERSPIHFVKAIHGRLLIVQGLQDPNVTPENVRVVTAALHAAGVEHELLAFADEGHGISKPRNQRTLYLRLADFFGNALEAAGRRT